MTSKSRKTSLRAAKERPAEVGDISGGLQDVMRFEPDAEERAALCKRIEDWSAPSTDPWFAAERNRLEAEDPLSADDRAVAERSMANRQRMLSDLFNEPYWPRERVLLWIGYRTWNVFDESFLSAMQAAKTYTPYQRPKTKLWCNNPRRELLLTLQDGRLRAVRNGAELPPEAWATATERQGWTTADRFPRDKVLARWPDPETQTAEATRDNLGDGPTATHRETESGGITLSSWKIPPDRPPDRQPKRLAAWHLMRKLWGKEIPRKISNRVWMTPRMIAEKINKNLSRLNEIDVGLASSVANVSETTVRRVLDIRKE
jgi:hypothetical protein